MVALPPPCPNASLPCAEALCFDLLVDFLKNTLAENPAAVFSNTFILVIASVPIHLAVQLINFGGVATHFGFIAVCEVWRDDAALAVHLEQPWVIDFSAKFMPLLETHTLKIFNGDFVKNFGE